MNDEVVGCADVHLDQVRLSPQAAYIALHVGTAAIILTVLTGLFVKGHLSTVITLAMVTLGLLSMPKKLMSRSEAIRASTLIIPLCMGIHLSATLI